MAMMDLISVAAALRRLGGEPVNACGGVQLVASRLGPELRVCGSYSAKVWSTNSP
jgi:hypothetical protein